MDLKYARTSAEKTDARSVVVPRCACMVACATFVKNVLDHRYVCTSEIKLDAEIVVARRSVSITANETSARRVADRRFVPTTECEVAVKSALDRTSVSIIACKANVGCAEVLEFVHTIGDGAIAKNAVALKYASTVGIGIAAADHLQVVLNLSPSLKLKFSEIVSIGFHIFLFLSTSTLWKQIHFSSFLRVISSKHFPSAVQKST